MSNNHKPGGYAGRPMRRTIAPRRSGTCMDPVFVERCRAHRLLDEWCAGQWFSRERVDAALRTTGDLT